MNRFFSLPPHKSLIKLLFFSYFFSQTHKNSAEIYRDDVSFDPSQQIEVSLGPLSDFPANSLRKMPISRDFSLLVSNFSGKLRALSAQCPYDDGDLLENLQISDKIFCPRHISAFSAETGRVEYGPELEDLRVFELFSRKSELFVRIPRNFSRSQAKIVNFSKLYVKKQIKRVVLLGDDPGVLSCLQTLRISGFDGEIIAVFEDSAPFFDKKRGITEKKREFFEKMRTKLVFDCVESVSTFRKTLKMRDFQGNTYFLPFDELVWAKPARFSAKVAEFLRELPAEAQEYRVFELKSSEEREKLQEIVEKRRFSGKTAKLLVLGAEINGLHTAANLRKWFPDAEIAIFMRNPQFLREEYGEFVEKFVKNELEALEIAIFSQKSQVLAINFDAVVPKSREFFENSLDLLSFCVQPDENCAIPVDLCLQSGLKNVYFLGDCVSFPLAEQGFRVNLLGNRRESVNQGSFVAFNLLNPGSRCCYSMFPSDFATFGDKTLTFIGDFKGFDECFAEKVAENGSFLAVFVKDCNIVGAAGCGFGKEMAVLYEGMRNSCVSQGKSLDFEEIMQCLRRKEEKNKCQMDKFIRKNLDNVEFRR